MIRVLVSNHGRIAKRSGRQQELRETERLRARFLAGQEYSLVRSHRHVRKLRAAGVKSPSLATRLAAINETYFSQKEPDSVCKSSISLYAPKKEQPKWLSKKRNRPRKRRARPKRRKRVKQEHTRVVGQKFDMDYCHIFKHRSPSSALTREARDLALQAVRKNCTIDTLAAHKKGAWRKRSSKHRRMLWKEKKIAGLPLVPPDVGKDKNLFKAMLKNDILFFSGTSENAAPGIPNQHVNIPVLSAPKNLVVLDNPDGLHMPGVFKLIPRAETSEAFPKHFLSHVYNGLSYMEGLNTWSTTRDQSERIVCQETQDDGSAYLTFGTFPKRNSQGLDRNLKGLDSNKGHHRTVGKFIRTVERLGAAYMDSESLEAIKSVKETSNYQGLDCGDGDESTMWPAVACGRNVFLSSHFDFDFFWSVTTVIQVEDDTGGDGKLNMDSAICNYFCFPDHGVCVALRSGDILVFNPLVYHCVSSRCNTEKDVFCISMYLKTAVVGGNHNGDWDAERKKTMDRSRKAVRMEKSKAKADFGVTGVNRTMDNCWSANQMLKKVP